MGPSSGSGQAGTCGTGAEIRTEYQYWGDTPLVTLERRIDGATILDTTSSYDAAGRLLSIDGPLAGTDDAQYNRYDVYGRKTWQIGAAAPDGLRIATRTFYRNSDDKPLYSETGTIPNASSTSLAVFRRTDSAAGSATFAYDANGNLTSDGATDDGPSGPWAAEPGAPPPFQSYSMRSRKQLR